MLYVKLIFLLFLLMVDPRGVFHAGPGIFEKKTEEIQFSNNSLTGTWRLSHTGVAQNTSNSNTDSLRSELVQGGLPRDFLVSFFPDSSFTEISLNGEYLTGKWSYKEDDTMVTMLYQNGKTKTYKASYANEKGLRLVTLESFTGTFLPLGGFGKSMEKFKEDPFFAANNTWRIKSADAEDKTQITVRLLDYLEHIGYLLKAAEIRKQQFISWEFSKGIIKVYNGGIGLVEKDKISSVWIDCFHTKEDAFQAYDILDNYLRTSAYKGKYTGSWVTTDYNIIISIIEGLKKRSGLTKNL